MASIVSSRGNEKHLETYRQWVSSQWGSDHSFEESDSALIPPPPLLAVEEGNLAGGLSFTWHRRPGSSGVALWINTVYVEPSCRGKGIASALIAEAEKHAAASAAGNELLVYTDTPRLYRRNQWSLVQQDREMYILRKPL